MEFGANCLKNDLWPFFTVKHTHVLHTAAQLARDNIFLQSVCSFGMYKTSHWSLLKDTFLSSVTSGISTT